MIAVGSFCLTFTMISDKKYYIALGCVTLALTSVVVFYFIEKRHLFPIIPLYLMKNPITAITGANIINFIFLSGNAYILPQYASIKGISSTKISIVLTLSNGLNLGGSIIIPILQKKILTRILLTALYVIVIILATTMMFILESTVSFMISFIIIAFACSNVSAILYPLTMMSVPP